MILVRDIRPFLVTDVIQGVIVGAANPPVKTLRTIASAAGLKDLSGLCLTECTSEVTHMGNFNGGFYVIPNRQIAAFSEEWKKWGLWLLNNIKPLRKVKREQHVDQVSFWLTIQSLGLPFLALPSNVNYHTHIAGKDVYLDETREIAMLHYHRRLNVLGQLKRPRGKNRSAAEAVELANKQIGAGFDNRVFWPYRYRHFPTRGSGIGSRGRNLRYKRRLLVEQGIEKAESVLDIGCGDLAVLRALRVKNYTGIDQSTDALATARRARPDWTFFTAPAPDAPSAQMVLCFDVLIHTESATAYTALIEFAAEKTEHTLLISGFAEGWKNTHHNPVLFFHEPLEVSLLRTGRFSKVREIGSYQSVRVYRCEV